MKGFVDLVFEYDDNLFRRLEIDWLGPDPSFYSRETGPDNGRKFLHSATQYLRIGAAPVILAPASAYDYETHFGGAFYISCAETRINRGVFIATEPTTSKSSIDFPWRHLSSVRSTDFGRAA